MMSLVRITALSAVLTISGLLLVAATDGFQVRGSQQIRLLEDGRILTIPTRTLYLWGVKVKTFEYPIADQPQPEKAPEHTAPGPFSFRIF